MTDLITDITTDEKNTVIKFMTNVKTRERLKSCAQNCGFGPRETNKFLNRMLEVTEQMPVLFKKTK